MCGIVAYIGEKKAEPILLDGLHKLEYRGYDSAGLAFLKNEKFLLVRAEGKLFHLMEKMKKVDVDATIGIGHTRWATHGKPSEMNAHPHYSTDVVLVHNGIVENYLTLKDDLIKRGFRFTSETDTEVVCHLIQDHINRGFDFLAAFQKSIAMIRGAFALVVVHRIDPDRIYVAKKASPLVLGLGRGENFVASDVPALLAHTRDVIFLDDDEMAVVTREKIEVMDLTGCPLQKPVRKIQWTAVQAEKEGCKHFMLKEIMEQPRVLSDTILGRINHGQGVVHFENVDALLEKFIKNQRPNLHIVACGTSWHAGLVGKSWIEELARIPVTVELASEFRYRKPLVGADTLVVPISQSGETADTLAAVTESKVLGASVLGICNVMEASIPRKSDATLYTCAGPEIGVASTKAFVTQLSVLYLLALKLAELKRTLPTDVIRRRLQALTELPKKMQSFMGHLRVIDAMTDQIYKHEHCYFLGRGIEFPIVLEGALKLKEISYIHAEGYAGGEMKHGPIALIEEGTPLVAVAVKDRLYEKMVSNIEEVQARGAHVFGLISKGDDALKKKLKLVVEVPDVGEDLLPFFTIVPLQLLAYHVADRKGTDVDQPRNLAKSVTVE